MSIVSFWCAFDARLQFSKPKRLWQYYPRCPYRKTLSASPSFRIIHAEVSLVSRLLVSPRLQPEKKTSLLTRGKQRTRSTDVVLSICLAPEKTGFCFVLGKSALMFRNKTSVPRGCTLLSHPRVKNVACPRICPTSKWAWHVHYYYFFFSWYMHIVFTVSPDSPGSLDPGIRTDLIQSTPMTSSQERMLQG